MTTSQRQLAHDIRELSDKLASDGWDRLRGLRLAHTATCAVKECSRAKWTEAIGRAATLADLFNDFAQEAPKKARLQSALQTATALADLLDTGQYAVDVEQNFLPSRPEDWLFVLTSSVFDHNAELAENLVSLGFAVTRVTTIDEAAEACLANRVILIADTSWLILNAERMSSVLSVTDNSFPVSSLLVAIADTGDFLSQVKARQLGARLLLDPPADAARLITELAGVAWMPRVAYRVMLVDDDVAVMNLHAEILRAAGFEVLAIDDPVAALDFLGDFSPDACVLDLEMPACRGTDLSALLRRNKHYTRLPVIYLSAFADVNHQLDARHAGGEDYLTKPVDMRLLVAAVMTRAQQFRLLETAYQQRRQAWFRLDNLKTALDAHAIVSVAAVDGAIINVNRKFCETSGYTREELIGRNHRIVKSGHHPTAFFEAMWQTLSSGQIWRGDLKNRRKDGSYYWVQSTIVPILNEIGLPEQYVSIRTDITEQKRIQAKRQHQTRLLDLLRQVLQQYLAHRNIEETSALLLDGMLLLTDSTYGFLSEVLYDPDGLPQLKVHALSNVIWDDATRRLYAENPETGLEHRNLDNLIDAVLSTGEVFTANDLANEQPPLEDFIGLPIHYGETLIGIVGLANRPDRYDVSSIVDFLQPFTATYASILEAVRVRHFQQQAILDLQQARDDAERAGRDEAKFLTDWSRGLRTPLNTILGYSQMLQVNKTTGIETQHRFAEIARSSQELNHLVDALLRRIDAKDTAKTTQEAKAPIIAEAQRNSDAVQRRILVAEDNPANQAVLRMQLGVLGYAVDIAVDGASAMLKWQAGGHDLILADRNMPVMDGLELTRAIRATERENGAHVPVIAITAAQHPEEFSLCRQAGMDDVLPKPIELDDLRMMLERWLPYSSPSPARNDALSARSGENKAILDTHYLSRIIGSADAKRTRELIDLFTSTAHYGLVTCRQHLAERSGHKLTQVMHRLKSSAYMVGAFDFARLAENLEDAAKANNLSESATLLSELELALGDVETAASRLDLSVTPVICDADSVSLPAKLLPNRVLIVDDEPVARRQMTMLLSSLGIHDVLAVGRAEAALIELARVGDSIDLLISDLKMPGIDGVEFLRHLSDNNYRGGVIIASGVEERLLQTAAEMVRAKGINLRGTLKKPVSRNELLNLLTVPCETTKETLPVQPEKITITPDDIQKGIGRNEFDVHFQPKVDAATLKVVGMEALARWRCNGNSVSPDIFIKLAEQHDLIGPLSEVLITKALIGGARLAEAGYPLTIAVNLSALWLSDIRLPEFIMASVQATGFKAENLILEITETGVMADMSTALDVMTRLRLKGFKLSIDDFGTGYSSMEQLQRIPFCELKLNKSFVQGATEKTAARAILASSIEIARKMKLSTVAEGVEIQAELDLVRGLGCDLVQGWFIAKAMSVEQLLVWLKERSS